MANAERTLKMTAAIAALAALSSFAHRASAAPAKPSAPSRESATLSVSQAKKLLESSSLARDLERRSAEDPAASLVVKEAAELVERSQRELAEGLFEQASSTASLAKRRLFEGHRSLSHGRDSSGSEKIAQAGALLAACERVLAEASVKTKSQSASQASSLLSRASSAMSSGDGAMATDLASQAYSAARGCVVEVRSGTGVTAPPPDPLARERASAASLARLVEALGASSHPDAMEGRALAAKAAKTPDRDLAISLYEKASASFSSAAKAFGAVLP